MVFLKLFVDHPSLEGIQDKDKDKESYIFYVPSDFVVTGTDGNTNATVTTFITGTVGRFMKGLENVKITLKTYPIPEYVEKTTGYQILAKNKHKNLIAITVEDIPPGTLYATYSAAETAAAKKIAAENYGGRRKTRRTHPTRRHRRHRLTRRIRRLTRRHRR